MQIPLAKLEPYLSAYLSGGWKKDELALDGVEIEHGWIRGNLRVVDYFIPSDGEFHLTVPLAFIWVAQLAIFYACWEHNLSEKPGEVYLHEINIRCKKAINKTEDISILLTLGHKRYLEGSVYYIGDIDIDDGAFVGQGKFIIPMPLNFVAR